MHNLLCKGRCRTLSYEQEPHFWSEPNKYFPSYVANWAAAAKKIQV